MALTNLRTVRGDEDLLDGAHSMLDGRKLGHSDLGRYHRRQPQGSFESP